MPSMIVVDQNSGWKTQHLFAMFRSHDFGRKAYGNCIGLGKLINMISHETDYDIGLV